MWKKLTIGLGVFSAILIVGNVYFLSQCKVEHELAITEKEARIKAEANIKELQIRYDALQDTQTSRSRQTSIIKNTDNGGRTRDASAYAALERVQSIRAKKNANQDLIKSLELSEPDRLGVLQILADDESKSRQIIESYADKPVDSQVMESLRNETNQQLLKLLGREKFEQYENYRKRQLAH